MSEIDTPKSAGGASAAVEFACVVNQAEELASQVTNAMCLATVQESWLNDHIFCARLSEDKRQDLYYVAPLDKNIILFTSHDLQMRFEALGRLADNLYEALFQMQERLASEKLTVKNAPSSEFESALQAWRAAHEALLATEKDGAIACDTPEERAETAALSDLAECSCASLDEVRRKAELFQYDGYLNGMAPQYMVELLMSFSQVGR